MFPAFAHHYARLPERFFQRFAPVPVRAPRLLAFNRPLAEEMGFDLSAFSPEDAAQHFAGNRLPAGAEPLAQAYAGHQFGGFVPRLGDGRAVLLGEVVDRQGHLRDIQLKGAGATAFSRGGDGRSPLGPVLREYVVSEAMHALGIPTTRALAAVATGEMVYREWPLPGGILTRVADSHIRVGTFEYFAARRDLEGVRILADHAIDRHYPHIAALPEQERYLSLLAAVQERQAELVARWMGVGFIHGVMNTDNTSIAGITIDFGPCAFMESYAPDTVFSSVDVAGRYAYENQPWIAQWNLARLAETLLPLIDTDTDRAVHRATEVLERFPEQYHDQWLAVMRAKLGLQRAEPEDRALVESLHAAMQAGEADFTLTFRRLCDVAASVEAASALFELFDLANPIRDWLPSWHARLAREQASAAEIGARMREVNPAYIPRNHRIEEMITAAVEDDDLAPFETLRQVLSRPFEEQPEHVELARPAAPGEEVCQTFCGT